MRCFLALPLPGDTALAVADWTRRNWATLQRPVPPANYHVTLAFLGDVDPQRLDRLADCLTTSLAEHLPQPFTMMLDDTGYFPDSEVLWIGPRDLPDEATRLAALSRRAAGRAGIRTDKGSWRAHLTLARRVSPPPLTPLTPPAFVLPVNAIVLYESILDRAGARYRVREDWSFAC